MLAEEAKTPRWLSACPLPLHVAATWRRLMLQGPEKASLPPGPEIPTFGTVTFMLPAVFRPHLQTTPPGCDMCPAAEVTQHSG